MIRLYGKIKDGEVKLYFEVKDFGIGILKEKYKVIFESFFQVDEYII